MPARTRRTRRLAALLAPASLFCLGLAHAGSPTLVVDNAEDAGAGSLRDAIQLANATPSTPGQRISIEVPGSDVVLSLASDLPEIEALDLEIVATASPGFTIDGSDAHAIFRAGAGSQRLRLVDLHLRAGRAADGGCVRGSARADAELLIERLQFSDCRAVGADGAGGRGGAVFAPGDALDLRASRFTGNRAEGADARGGGLFSSARSLGLFDVRFDNNLAAQGGGLAVVGAGVDLVFLTDLRLQGNVADTRGGGLLVECVGCAATLSRGYLGQNSAGGGGAIAARRLGSNGVGPTLSLANLTLERNVAQVRGGGLELAQTEAELRQLTLQGNAAPVGAHLAIVESGNALGRVSNTVFGAVAVGSGGACSLVAGGPTPTQATGNLFADASCGNLASGGGTLPSGQLGSLAADGEAMPVLAFASDSAVVDGGSELACLQEDARAGERPLDGDGDGEAVCDVGAYEHPGSPRIFGNGFEGGL